MRPSADRTSKVPGSSAPRRAKSKRVPVCVPMRKARAAISFAALVLLVVAALAFLIGTQTGTRLLFARLGALLPGTFEVRSAEGRIDSPLTLHGVVYKRP